MNSNIHLHLVPLGSVCILSAFEILSFNVLYSYMKMTETLNSTISKFSQICKWGFLEQVKCR